MKLLRLIKMFLNETYSRVRVGKHLSDIFPIRNGLKQGDAVSPLLFNSALKHAIRRVQVNQSSLKLNDTQQLLVYADDVNTFGGRVDTITENSEALVVASMKIGLEVNADRTKYMVMSRDQNAGRNHSIKIDNSSFASVEELKYLETTFIQNYIQEEIKSRLKSGNAFYRSVQCPLSCSMLPKNSKIKICRTIIFPFCFVWV